MNIARSSAQIFLTRGVRLAITFATGILMARWLQPEGRGAYSLVSQFVVLAAAFGGMSINQSTIHFSGSARFTTDEQVSNAVSSTIIFSVISCAAILAFSGPLGAVVPLGGAVTAAVLILVPVLILDAYLRGVLQSLYRFHWLNGLEIFQAAILAALVFLCYSYEPSSYEKALYLLLIAAAISLAALLVLVKRLAAIRLRFNPLIFREHLSFGLKAHLSTIMGLLCLRLDQYILGYLTDRAAVGKYAIAVSLAELVLFLPASVAFVLLPRAAHVPEGELVETIKKSCLIVFGISLATAAVLSLISSPLILYGYGEEYGESVNALRLLLPGTVFLSVAAVTTPYFLGRLGKPYIGAIVAAVLLIVNTALDFLLIPIFGINGASIASSVAYFIATCLNLFFFFRFQSKKAEPPAMNEPERGIE